MSSIVEKDQGLYDPNKRYAFTNITTEDFTSHWGGSPIVVKAGESVELQQHLADKMTDELVDSIMIGKAKLDEVAYYEKHPDMQANTYRAPSSLGVPAARKVWEDQIVRELAADEESPQLQVERARIREELLADLNQEPSSGPVGIPTSLGEFSELGKSEPVAPKAPLKVKKIK